MTNAALIEQLDALSAFLTAHPGLPHPLDLEINDRVYGGSTPLPQINIHLSVGHEGRYVESIDAAVTSLGSDDWELFGNSVEKIVDDVEVTIFLPSRKAEPGLAERLMQLGWVRATEDAI